MAYKKLVLTYKKLALAYKKLVFGPVSIWFSAGSEPYK
jgi:hypothetical protein